MKTLDHKGCAWIIRNANGRFLRSTARSLRYTAPDSASGWTSEIDEARVFGSKGHAKLCLQHARELRGFVFDILPCRLVPALTESTEQYAVPSGR